MLNFSNCNCLLQQQQKSCQSIQHCIIIPKIVISLSFCLDAFSILKFFVFKVLRFVAICNNKWARERDRGREQVCACVCAPTFFFIITVKNRQNPWHTITKHKQASCNHSCPTRRTKRIFHQPTLVAPCNVPYCAPGTMLATAAAVTSSYDDAVIIRKLPEPSKTNDDVQPQTTTSGEGSSRQTDEN